MSRGTRQIELDVEAVEAFETEAEARGMSLRDFLAEVAISELHADIDRMRDAGVGPWSPQALAEDARAFAEFKRTGEAIPIEDVRAWVESWDSPNELPPPQPRKL